MFDQEFNTKMNIANCLVKNMKNKWDAERAKKWLVRLGNLKSPDLQVKKRRNAFLSCLINVLEDGVLAVCRESCSATACDPNDILQLLDELENRPPGPNGIISDNPNKKETEFHSKWSNDKKTYVAVKPIPGKGALIFMAVSKRSGLQNWNLPLCNEN